MSKRIESDMFAGMEFPPADLAMLDYIIWYGRTVRGRVADVAKALWRECPYVRLSDKESMSEENWTLEDEEDWAATIR